MATPPLVCNTIQFEGAIFQRCNLQVIRGTTVLREISLCDTNIVLNNYSSFSGCVYANSSLILNAEGLGELCFIMIKATYPSVLPVSSRFINILYNGAYMPMANLTILTGNPSDISPYMNNRGWDLDPDGSDIESPFFSQGGMLLYNPHSVRVNIDVILGGNI
ncbi:MAG: hypothetical protein EBS19_04170 [Spirochaetia bacterium]|nr:hypothetical protein [Spirochaetia bacterium]